MMRDLTKTADRRNNTPHQGDAARAGETNQPNEGEGNRTAARNYNRKTTEFALHGPVEKKAREAKDALEGKEGDELRKAEELGKSRSHGEDPAVAQPSAGRRK